MSAMVSTNKRPQKKGERCHKCVFKCKDGRPCKMAFVRNSDLVRHEKIHTGVREHECPVCKKRFIQKTALKVHMRTHTGEKPYVCLKCGKAFSDSSSRSRHSKIHTREGQVICNVPGCGKSYARKSGWEKHCASRHPLTPESPEGPAAMLDMSASTPATPEEQAPPTPQHQPATEWPPDQNMVSPLYGNGFGMLPSAGQQPYGYFPPVQPVPTFPGYYHHAPPPEQTAAYTMQVLRFQGQLQLPLPLPPPPAPATNHVLQPAAQQFLGGAPFSSGPAFNSWMMEAIKDCDVQDGSVHVPSSRIVGG